MPPLAPTAAPRMAQPNATESDMPREALNPPWSTTNLPRAVNTVLPRTAPAPPPRRGGEVAAVYGLMAQEDPADEHAREGAEQKLRQRSAAQDIREHEDE